MALPMPATTPTPSAAAQPPAGKPAPARTIVPTANERYFVPLLAVSGC